MLWLFVDHVGVVQVAELVNFQNFRIGEVVSDKEAILFSFQPPLGCWKQTCKVGRRDFKLHVVYLVHIFL